MKLLQNIEEHDEKSGGYVNLNTLIIEFGDAQRVNELSEKQSEKVMFIVGKIIRKYKSIRKLELINLNSRKKLEFYRKDEERKYDFVKDFINKSNLYDITFENCVLPCTILSNLEVKVVKLLEITGMTSMDIVREVSYNECIEEIEISNMSKLFLEDLECKLKNEIGMSLKSFTFNFKDLKQKMKKKKKFVPKWVKKLVSSMMLHMNVKLLHLKNLTFPSALVMLEQLAENKKEFVIENLCISKVREVWNGDNKKIKDIERFVVAVEELQKVCNVRISFERKPFGNKIQGLVSYLLSKICN